MKLFANVACLLILFTWASTALAQGYSSWAPSQIPNFDFEDVVLAKVYQAKDGTDVLGVISFEPGTETEIVTVTVQKCRLETRTRTVELESGELGEQTYTVQVPYTEQIQQERRKVVQRRIEVPLDAATIIRIVNGLPVYGTEAKEILKAPKRCFLRPEKERPTAYSHDWFFAEIFNEDVLVIWYDPEKAREIVSAQK